MPICITPVSFYHAKAYAVAFPLSRLLYFFTSVVLLRVIPLFVCRDSCCSLGLTPLLVCHCSCCFVGADAAACMRAAVAPLGLKPRLHAETAVAPLRLMPLLSCGTAGAPLRLTPLLARSCCCCPVDWSCNTQHNVERTQNIKIRFALFSLKDGAISDVPEIRF